MVALDNAFGSLDGVTNQIGFGQVPGFDALQRSTSRIGFGSALGSGQQMGAVPIGQGSVPGGIRGDARPIGGYDDFLDGTYGQYLAGIQQDWNDLMGQMPGGGGFGGVGAVTSPGGEWAKVDQWDQYVLEASRQFGIPGNLLKAIMRLESGGDPGSTSVAGAVGLMQVMPQYWGDKGYDIYSTRGNVMAGAFALKSFYDQWSGWAGTNGMDPWEAATKAYLAGSPTSTAQDAYGTDANSYWNRINGYLGELGGMGSVGNVAAGQNAIASMFPAGSVHDWGEFDVPSNNGMYGYGVDYGMNGSNHTGIDIAMPIGSPMYAPVGGQVMCAGTGVGGGTEGGGCSAFNDVFGGGAGRIEILLDNGAVLIYGHSSQAAVKPGQRVAVGSLLGYSGGMVSPHIHLEARVRDPNTASGWRIVDPREVLGGGFASAPGQGGGGYTQPMSQNQLILSLILGRKVPGYN